jgi:hypothetical protein
MFLNRRIGSTVLNDHTSFKNSPSGTRGSALDRQTSDFKLKLRLILPIRTRTENKKQIPEKVMDKRTRQRNASTNKAKRNNATSNVMTTNNNTGEKEDEEEDVVQVLTVAIEEEFWPTATITANNLLAGHRTHAIYFGISSNSSSSSVSDNNDNNDNIENDNDTKIINNSNRGRVLRYKSMSSEAMTPLDMTYGGQQQGPDTTTHDNDDDNEDDDEFYDGTGNLMWMAAVCFGHLVAQRVEPLQSYLSYLPTTTTTTTTKPCYSRHNRHHRRLHHRRVCELGCGTGGAGISLLLFSNNNNNKNNNNNSVSSSHESESEYGSCHVVFTDNDIEIL